MNDFKNFLKTSYTPYQAVENAEKLLKKAGFILLAEGEIWQLQPGGKYYVVRGGSSMIAFQIGDSLGYKIIASHIDSPALKLKENPALSDSEYTRLNTEPYGGGLWYSFFDRPLKIAGRAVYQTEKGLAAKNFVSDFSVVIPSLAIHMNRDANERFSPALQTELPLLCLGKKQFDSLTGNPVSYDLFAVCAETPFENGANSEFLSSPRIDNLTGVYTSLLALTQGSCKGTCVVACLDSEEVGNRTRQGAGSNFLASVLRRISCARGGSEEDYYRALSSSFLISMDNAHALHPNHPEKCDPTNRAVMGGGLAIKSHAGGAYTTDALTSATIKTIFNKAGVKYQTFYNRSDMRSGGTLGAISLGQVSLPSVDMGIAQLAMHSAVETMAKSDYLNAVHGLTAFFETEFRIAEPEVAI